MLNFKNINLQDIIDDNTETVDIVSTKDIAIIGISTQLPMADNADEFWNNLSNKMDCITNFPGNRQKDMDSYVKCVGINSGQVKYNLGGYLREIDKFDNKFFKISPKEASLMDPNQRLFLEIAWKTIEDAGYGEDKIKGSRTGVYLGFNSDAIFDYKRMVSELEEESGEMAVTGNLTSVIGSRISYLLDFKGPSISIDTACSSSLVALHTACQGIKDGDCDMAIAGSVKINILPYERKQKLGIESSDSRTKTFDDSSDGTGMGEGVAAVLLKPLNKAIEDKDNIYALIKGSAINQDGKSIGISAPNAVAQEDVIVKAWNDAGINPETISYIEAHGTGTILGDPIEIDGIQRAFSRYTNRKQFCGIGSAKTNIGHLDNASGIVGLIKVALALKYKQIPASINFNFPNRKISFEESPVYINTELKKWETSSNPRRAGVSAFGLSGTNCHIVLEEYQEKDTSNICIENNKHKILCLSAKSQNSLNSLINEYKEYLQKNEAVDIQHICYTANTGRGHYNYRLAVVGSNAEEILYKVSNIKLPITKKTVIINNNIFYNKLTRENNVNSLTKAANEKIEELRNSGIADIDKVRDVCELYIEGANIEWDKLYEPMEKKKVSVPTYPFERIRCWIDIPEVFESLNTSRSNIKHTDKKQVNIELKGREDNKYSNIEIKIASAWGEVLGFRELKVTDSFYELGGDSIAAMKVVNRLNQSMNMNIGVAELLKHQTIEAVAACIEDKYSKEEEVKESIYSIQPAEKKGYYSLSSAQKRLFILNQIAEVGTSYNIEGIIEIKGEIDKKRLQEAFYKLLQKHESLRTSFDIIDGEPVQRIHENVIFNLEEIKSDMNRIDSDIRTFVKLFELTKAPLIRAALIEVEKKKHILIVDMHHIISDGTSVGILIKDVVDLYDKGTTTDLRIQYKDFAEWQKYMLISENIKKQEQYWLNTFSGEIPVLNLPTDYTRTTVQSFEGASLKIQLNETTTKKLKNLANKTNTTLYTVLLAAYNVLLSKYSGQEDIIVGSLIEGRPHADLENIIGMFVNTLAIRNFPEGEKSFKSFLMEVSDNSLEALSNQAYQFEELIDKLNITRDFSRNPLFDTLFVMQNMDMPEVKIEDTIIRPYEFESKTTRFDLSLQAKEIMSNIIFIFDYSTKLFKEETIQRLAMHYENIINIVINDINIKLSQIDILSQSEKSKLLVEFNNTEKQYNRTATIHQLIEAQAKAAPNNIAVKYEDKQISYKELNDKANQLARVLMQKSNTKGEVIALVVERSIEFITGILAVLKAGGAYLPINPEYPEDRINYILEDSRATIVLTEQKYINKIKAENVINLEDEAIYAGTVENIACEVKAEDTAYVIYTSGSTGKPKGVAVPHRALNNFLNTLYDKFNGQVEAGDNCLSLTNISFDVSVGEIFLPLCYGGSLALYHNDEILDINRLSKFIIKNNITFGYIPPTILKDVYELLKNSGEKISLNKILVGVEPIKDYVLYSYFDLNPSMQIVNGYGPTEATICSTMNKVEKIEATGRNVSIGKPMINTQIYILDKNNKLQPMGIAGELCIAGDQLAKGYLSKEELTAEKFVQNPFKAGEVMYKTGDMARWLTDGNIEFLGRIDNQVKIRGFRIELGEIESQLLKYEDISEVIVIAREDKSDGKYLCGYICGGREYSVSELREHLSKELPEYMIPSYFIQLDKLPLTANGKVDRKALPEPDGSITTGTEYEAPRNEIEEKLVNIWQEVLGIERIGINDNFFELGGHSLKAINIAAKINKVLNVSVPLGEMFKIPTIKGLSGYVEGTTQNVYSRIEPVEEKEYYEMSSAQKRIYTLQQFELYSTSYNMPIIMTIDGRLDKTKLKEAFNKLIQRHEALRTSFEIIHGEAVQIINTEVSFEIEYTEVSTEKISEIVAGFVKAFDLSKAPLIRVALTKINDKEHVLMIDMHHIISDGVSMGILTKEFIELYDDKELPKLRIQYKDFAVWQNELFKSGGIKKQEEYWLKAFEGEVPVLNMPADYQRPSIQSFEGDNINFELNEELTDKLKGIAKETGSTMYMVLLSACNVLLSKYSGQEDIIIGSPIAGRPHADLENIIGMFVNTIAMRNYPESQKTFKEFLEEVKKSSLQAFENQDYQFEELIDKLNITRDLSRNPLFDVMFSMQNMDAHEMQMEGLSFKPYEIDSKIAKFDITITATEFDKTIGLSLNYSTKLFNKQTIQRMSKHLTNILDSISNNTDLRISEVEMLSDGEKQQILVEFNNTKAEYQKDKIIQQLFEEQVEKTPSNIGVVYKEDKLTYKELNEKANIIARILRNKGIKQNEIVGIMVEGSTEMIVGILGILKAGATYLPIDPKYPTDRITYMIEDSKTKILLTDFRSKDIIGENTELILLKDKQLYKGENTNLEVINTPRDIAYIIYTSGSTGKPKGVMIEHSSLINLSKWHIDYYKVTEKDNSTKYAGFGFDASVWEIFPYIITGATIHIIDEEIKLDIEKLNQYYNDNDITISFLPTQICEQFMKQDNKSLRYLLAGGDKLRYFEGKNYKVVNNYGPTENTVVTTSFILDKEYENIPIGKPIANTQIYIISKENKLQPIGIPGELCIAGENLARGYLNNIKLTAEKFIENPFVKAQRLYKTGDLARWLPDGNIEFLGRIDNQVKIRGYRIELGEIENQLLSHSDIKEAIVITREDKSNNKYLCGYILSERKEIISELREYLAKELPEYMIPAYFIQLDKMPFTANGKIERKALPESDGSVTTGTEYAAPESEIEEKLVSIWQEVLDVEKVGINNNFFELGGHSLKAISISAKISKDLNVTVPLGELFKTPTIKGLANYVEGTKQSIYSRIEPVIEKEYYELSSAQKRIYTLQQFEENSTSYNMPMIMTLEGELDKAKLEETFDKLIQRHDALRTSFEVIDGEPVQIVHKKVSFEIEYTEESKERAIEIAAEFVKTFDLKKAPLIRVALTKINDKEHILMIDIHHIISDGVSMGILTKEFMELYDGKELSKLRIQYKDFAVWQNELFKSGGIKKQEEYWLKAFEGDIPVLSMPTDYQRPVMQSFEGDNIPFAIEKEISHKLKQICRKTGTTTYMVLLAAYNILLSKYSAEEDIIVGTPISGRPHADLENIMGMFVNTLAMRNYPKGNKTFKEFLEEVKASSLSAFENQDYQFEELIDKLNIKRDLSRNPLFDVMFSMHNVDNNEISIGELEIKPYNAENKISKFDMTLTAVESEDNIVFNLNYCTSLYSKKTIEKLIKHFTNILEGISNNINQEISEIDMLTKEEKHQIINEFNNTKAEYPKHKTIHELFEEQAQSTPDSIAVIYEDKKLTYNSLNKKSNQMARVLRSKGVKADSIVAIMAERSIDMITGIMGIIKAGGAYLPIDPEYPNDRIAYMLEDSKANILLTQTQLINKADFGIELIDLEDNSLYIEDDSNLNNINTTNNLIYTIYTSGSTGKPKGVMVEHKNLVNLVYGLKERIYKENKNLKVSMVSPYVFDASVKQIFPSLLLGHTLYIIPEDARLDAYKLYDYYTENHIDIADGTPTHLKMITALEKQNVDINIKQFVIGGEALSTELVEEYYSKYNKNCIINNVYGPTECCDVTTVLPVTSNMKIKASIVPIGYPISNAKVYILDRYNKAVAIGVLGELCISGAGVTRGYLNRAELTAEKFVDNPYEMTQKMYKTGDLVRWLEDGNIEFLGRIDHQVKIRGFRIELGEIEARLLSYEGIEETIVIAREAEGNKYICAYITGNREFTVSELREHLSKELPEYMIPTYFIQLDKLPLTANGKVDRKALPEPDGSISTGAEYVAPESEIEEKLVSIWSEVLGIQKVGINDNFFELGGHSLKAINIAAKIHKELNVSVPLKEMFKTPTIKGLATYVESTKQSIYSRIEPVEEREYYPLSSAQKRIYTLQQFEENNISYNIPMVMKLEGELDKTKLEEAFNKLIQRHEALRTSFEVIDGEPVQVVHKEISFEIEYTEADEEKAGEIATVFVKAFNLSKAPLIRVVLVKINDKEHILMIDKHHIISDGVSMGILTKEFIELYDDKELAELRIQYKDFAVWQNELFKSGEIKKQEEYWLKAFEGEVPVLNMPTDYQRPSLQSFEGDNVNLELSEDLTNKLKQIARETGSTMYMVLLSACNVLLSKYSGQEDTVIGSPISGRPHADLQNIMGMFVNTLAMRNYPKSNKTFKEFLVEVKTNSLQAFENQDYQFEELIDKLSISRDLSRNPLFDVMFTMQNMDAGELQIEGIRFKPYEIDNKIAKFDMTITAVELKETIMISLNYCTKLFNNQTIQSVGKHLINILNSIAYNTNLRLSEVEMLSEEEKHKLLVEFNNTKTEYPKDKTIQQLFEEQAEKTPNNIAVVYKKHMLTYKELNEKANIIARLLRNKGIKQNEIVGIMIEGSAEMLVGILGIQKAGAAYLPIDPKYPTDRIDYMIKDSKTRILLTDFQPTESISNNKELILLKDEKIYKGDNTNLEIINTSKDIAYVIYTSGSTGKPKGVMIEHRALINLSKWHINFYGVTEEDNSTKYAGFGFDASVWEIFPYIITGAAIHIIDEEIKLDIEKLNEYYNDNDITISFLPTQICEQFMKQENKSLRYLLSGGDKLRHFEGKNYKVVNNYGPTENTVVTTSFIVDKEYDNIPIGKPIANTQIYILGKTNKLQAIGVPGELCIAGESLARGYLNNTELTAEKFIENPFAKGQRLYRSGDLARWLPDGNIEFLGRIDNQVKIRGYRIELGEIESKLLSHTEIKEAVVIDKEDSNNNKYLCAYIAVVREQTVAELREYLSKELPEYMIPTYFLQLDKLPLTANGKVDRKALPEPDGSITTGAEYVAASNEIEEKLASIWSEVLGIEKIGINDNFFELGGHSLKAMNVTSKIKKAIGIDIPLKELFTTPTIKQLSEYISNNEFGDQKATPDDIVLIKKGSKKAKNVFIVHDGSGDISGYIELCNSINNDCNYWGIRAKKPTGYYPTNITIEEMASRYIEKIYNIQPEGSYNLVGWSLGGVIVFEIARLMEETGKKLEKLIMIDAPAPKTNIVNRIIKNTNKFSLEAEKKVAKLFNADDQIEAKIKSATSVEELWQQIIEYYEQNNLDIENIKQSEIRKLAIFIPEYESIEIRELVYNLNYIRALNMSSDEYMPKNKINTQMYMFEASENNMSDKKAWDKFLAHKMISERMPGNHFTMMQGQNVLKLAAKVKELLES